LEVFGIFAWTRFNVVKSPPNPTAPEAVEVLRGIQSVTNVGITYMEYSRRVLDATIKVDQFERSDDLRKEAKREAGAAMRCYQLAGQIWSAGIGKEWENQKRNLTSLWADPALSQCPGIVSMSQQNRDEAWMYGKEIFVGPLWACAGPHIDKAAKLLR